MTPLTASILLTQFSKLIPKLLDTIKEIKISANNKKLEDMRIKTSSYLESTQQMIVACKDIKGDRKLKNEKVREIFEALKAFQQSEMLNISPNEKENNEKIGLYKKYILVFNKLIQIVNNNSGIITSSLELFKIKASNYSLRRL